MNPRLAIAILSVVLVGYGIFRAIPLISGPHIILTSPTSDTSVSDGAVTISGSLVHANSVTLDGSLLITDEHGNFSSTVTLPPGDSIIKISAQDQFGRSTSQERIVYVP
jgi:hypothetical protein